MHLHEYMITCEVVQLTIQIIYKGSFNKIFKWVFRVRNLLITFQTSPFIFSETIQV